MEFKKEALYAKTHEWVIFEDDMAIIGISDYAQSELGDLVFVNLPEEDDDVVAGESFADVESVKAVSDIYSPVTGVVAEVNEALLDAPEMINEDAFGAWFIKVRDITDKSELISAEEYEAFCESEEE